jgi:site-specific DNA recombinase
VIVYRLDRLGRTARVLLDARDQLASFGVAISSATEPFDTRTSIGRFVFQLLGSIAELERETIRERMTIGRDRLARAGKFINGPVPFGYDVDDEDHLVPSSRWVAEVGMSEQELVRELFARVANGDSSVKVTRWLRAAGVRASRRYFNRRRREEREVVETDYWSPSRVCRTISNPVYRGVHVIRSAHGPIERSVVPLVQDDAWQAANSRLRLNKVLSFGRTRPDSHYLLRGLIQCENCGRHYVGQPPTSIGRIRLYRCNGSQIGAELQASGRCAGRALPADALELRVWSHIAALIRTPGPSLMVIRERLQRMEVATDNADDSASGRAQFACGSGRSTRPDFRVDAERAYLC